MLQEEPCFNLTTLVKTEENSEELERIATFIKDYKMVNLKDTYYLCENNSCSPPVNDINSIKDKF